MLAFLSFLIPATVLAAFTGPFIGLMYFKIGNELGPNHKYYHGSGMPVLLGIIGLYIVLPILIFLLNAVR